MEKLNKMDLLILETVTKDARITIKDLATACDASRSAVNTRLARLINNGTIKYSGFSVDPYAVGVKTCTFVGIRLEKGSYYQEVAERLKEIDEVVECHATTGPYAMMIKLFVVDNHDLMRILNGVIQHIPGVVDTETLISLDRSFERNIKLEGTPAELLVRGKDKE
ncbi:MAG: Lrp/AsnC family transcriptional regulator [Porphyromonas sp.]|nr:Lrp/AsnC family transcriptional regulator [Porphyromonas sp.]